MNGELIIRLPPDFILSRTVPTAVELAHGYAIGWLSADDVRAIAQAKRDLGFDLSDMEVALLTAVHDFANDDAAIQRLGTEVETEDDPRRVWLYLGIAALWTRRHDLAHPLDDLALLIATFGYPEEVLGLLHFMPVPPGEPVGVSVFEDRWRDYLEREGEYYRSRQP